MSPEDFITINGTHTFRKSEIQGFTSDFWYSNNNTYMILYVIVSGTQLLVDKEYCRDIRNENGKLEVSHDDQLIKYHKRWKDRIQEKLKSKKEMI